MKDFESEIEKLGKQDPAAQEAQVPWSEVLSGIYDSGISRYERGKENIAFQTILE